MAEFRHALELAASIQAARHDAYDTLARTARAEHGLREVVGAERAVGAADGELERLTRDAELVAQDCARREETVRERERDLNAIQATLDQVRAALEQQFPDGDWWRDRSRRELAALWTDAEWNRARTELFLAALRLHKAFLHHVPEQMSQSLQAAVDIVAGDAPQRVPDGAALTAWQALFFVVPVVSTTFASFARVFSHLGQEALGWVLIDEAGQATPQSAVGALWRSKRAVIVGDPLQLEPITTLPFRAEQAIRGDHGVDEQWLSSRTSVQRLADRLTQLDTWLPCDEDTIWVGAPLTVHRRCDQPMFGIANDTCSTSPSAAPNVASTSSVTGSRGPPSITSTCSPTACHAPHPDSHDV
ncbi:MAG: AAA domain-containing protein [Pseudonocardiaceae bacterium]